MKQLAGGPKKNGYIGNNFIPLQLYSDWLVSGCELGGPCYLTADESKLVTMVGTGRDSGTPGEDNYSILCVNTADGSTVWSAKAPADAAAGGSYLIGLDSDDHPIVTRASVFADSKVHKLNIATGAPIWSTVRGYYFPYRSGQLPALTPHGMLCLASSAPYVLDMIDLATGAVAWSKTAGVDFSDDYIPARDAGVSCYAAEYGVVFQNLYDTIYGFDAATGTLVTQASNYYDPNPYDSKFYALAWDPTYADPEKQRRVGMLWVQHHHTPVSSPWEETFYQLAYEKPLMKYVRSSPGNQGHQGPADYPSVSEATGGQVMRLGSDDEYITISYVEQMDAAGYGGDSGRRIYQLPGFYTIQNCQFLQDSNRKVLLVFSNPEVGLVAAWQTWPLSNGPPERTAQLLWELLIGPTLTSLYTMPCVDSSSSLYLNTSGILHKYKNTPKAGSKRSKETVLE